MEVRRRATAVLNKEGSRGRGVRGGLTGGPTELGQVHGAERGRGAAERSRRRSARGKREDGDDKRARAGSESDGVRATVLG